MTSLTSFFFFFSFLYCYYHYHYYYLLQPAIQTSLRLEPRLRLSFPLRACLACLFGCWGPFPHSARVKIYINSGVLSVVGLFFFPPSAQHPSPYNTPTTPTTPTTSTTPTVPPLPSSFHPRPTPIVTEFPRLPQVHTQFSLYRALSSSTFRLSD